jgi:outer membrane protein TolC
LTIDERVQRLVSATQTRTNTVANTPNLRRTEDHNEVSRARQVQQRPETVNLDASAINYVPAAENRDVRARLDRYADQAGVRSPGTGESAGQASPASSLPVNLSTALRQSQLSGREFISAEEELMLAAIRVLTERHLWGPRLFNDTTLGISGTGNNGQSNSALNVVNQLRATQRLPYGGSVEAAWVWNATEQLRDRATGRYEQSSRLALSGNVPLLRGAGLVAREDLIQAERDLIYRTRTFERFRRQYLVSICNDFFSLAQAKQQIANTERQIESFRTLEKSTAARVAAGRLEAFETNLTRNQTLSAEASLAGQRESYILQVERFKIRLGLPLDARLDVREIDLDLPDPEIDMDEAVRRALEFRLDLQNTRDQLDDARRAVYNARDRLLPDLDLNGSIGVPTDPAKHNGGLGFSTSDLDYTASATLSLPLDREVERLNLRSQIISLQRRQREYEEERDSIVVRVRSSLRNVDLARFQLQLAEQQVEINRRRLEGQKLKQDTVTPQALVDSLNELLSAENSRDRARTELRNAILNYLLESDQLRVSREGTFEALQGMREASQAAPSTPTP